MTFIAAAGDRSPAPSPMPFHLVGIEIVGVQVVRSMAAPILEVRTPQQIAPAIQALHGDQI